MYKYIEGKEVLMQEHMLSATELAKLYGLLTVNNNPNGMLVCMILSDYVKDIEFPEYYYPHGHGVMRVYPSIIYDKALSNFIANLKEGEKYTYTINGNQKGKSKINFKYKRP